MHVLRRIGPVSFFLTRIGHAAAAVRTDPIFIEGMLWMLWRRHPRLWVCLFVLLWFTVVLTVFPHVVDAVEVKASSFADPPKHGGDFLGVRRPSSNMFHIFWVGTYPLRPILLAALDSIARYMPQSRVCLHITVEEAIPASLLRKRQDNILSQLQIFMSHGLRLQIVFHDDIVETMRDTPLQNLAFRQRHIGGVWGEPMHGYLGAHVTDVMRALIAYKEGGILMDDDNILLHDLSPLFETYGTAIFTTDEHDTRLLSCGVRLCTGFFSAPAGHPLIAEYINALSEQFKRDGLDYYFPRHGKLIYSAWDSIGPVALTKVHQKVCRSPYPPVIVTEVTLPLQRFLRDSLRSSPPIPEAASFDTASNTSSGSPRTMQYSPSCSTSGDALGCPLRPGSSSSAWPGTNKKPFVNDVVTYAVVSRKYLVPAFWTEHGFLLQKHRLAQPMLTILGAFQFHVFGLLKWKFLEHVFGQKERYPLLEYIHQQSCLWLCDAETWSRELPSFPRDQHNSE